MLSIADLSHESPFVILLLSPFFLAANAAKSDESLDDLFDLLKRIIRSIKGVRIKFFGSRKWALLCLFWDVLHHWLEAADQRWGKLWVIVDCFISNAQTLESSIRQAHDLTVYFIHKAIKIAEVLHACPVALLLVAHDGCVFPIPSIWRRIELAWHFFALSTPHIGDYIVISLQKKKWQNLYQFWTAKNHIL